MSDLVGNPEDRISHNEAHSIPIGSLLESARERVAVEVTN